VKNAEAMLTPAAVLRFEHPEHGTQFIRIKRTKGTDGEPLKINNDLDYGIELEGMPVDSEGKLRQSQHFTVTYDEFFDILQNLGNGHAMTNERFKSDIITTDPSDTSKIQDAREVEEDPVTPQNIASKLDLIDSTGSRFGFRVGTSFVAPSDEGSGTSKKRNSADIWTISKLSGDSIDLMASNGFIVKWLSLKSVYESLKNQWNFERIAMIPSDSNEAIEKELREFGHRDGQLKGGKYIVKETDDHGHEKEKAITCFKSKKGGHIRIESIEDGVVNFGEFEPGKNEMKTITEHTKKHGLDKEAKWLYRWQRMSYAAFIRYLQEHECSSTTEDLIIPDTDHDLHGHAPHGHMEGSFLKRMMRWQNPASIMKGFEMLYHGIEHTLEKWAKLDAARFAMKTSRFLHLPDSVDAQVYADITTASKEIVEKYEQKIFGLPGPAGRKKCIHIVHNKDSRPEEVVAAMNYMLKSYGHLYAEDAKQYQSEVNPFNIKNAWIGYFAFFDAFVLTAKLGDVKTCREIAYKRAITEMGTLEDHENEPTEEQLIHAIMKQVDGKWDQFLYAASVVKAIGWPSGFEKNWKLEGFDNAKKKWLEQTQMVSAQWRLNKWIAYFKTNELNKAVGAMQAIAMKVKDAKFQAMPFVWACAGFSRYMDHAALQKIKWYAENGYSFHAYSFLRNYESNKIYKDTVRLALADMDKENRTDLVGTFDAICKKFEFDPENPEKTDKAADELMKFWQEHYGSWLHDRLQGQNGWLVKKTREGNATVKAYRDKISNSATGGGHTMQLKDPSIPGGELGVDWFKEHWYANMILRDGENGLMSLDSMLNKIKFWAYSGGGKPMDHESNEKIWHYIVKYMQNGLKDAKSFGGDEALQREQYLAHRREIIAYFVQQLGTRTDKWDRAKNFADSLISNYPYFKDMQDMGIDPYALFSGETESMTASSDYERWKTWSGTIRRTEENVPYIREIVMRNTDNAISSIDRGKNASSTPKAWPRTKTRNWPHGAKTQEEWSDSDASQRWWAWGDMGEGRELGGWISDNVNDIIGSSSTTDYRKAA
jgi:hypothetical protein